MCECTKNLIQICNACNFSIGLDQCLTQKIHSLPTTIDTPIQIFVNEKQINLEKIENIHYVLLDSLNRTIDFVKNVELIKESNITYFRLFLESDQLNSIVDGTLKISIILESYYKNLLYIYNEELWNESNEKKSEYLYTINIGTFSLFSIQNNIIDYDKTIFKFNSIEWKTQGDILKIKK